MFKQTVLKLQTFKHSLKHIAPAVLFGMLILGPVILANRSWIANAAELTVGYVTQDTQLKTGMAVSFSETGTSEQPAIERARVGQDDKVIGITVSPEDATVVVAEPSAQAFVVASGEAYAYVVDVNGPIKQGDNLVVSPIRGLLAKAPENSQLIVGGALEEATSENAETITYADSTGAETTAQVYKLRINVDPKAISATGNAPRSSLERLGEQVVGRDVTEIQIVAALVIFIVLLVIEGGVIYGAVASAVAALGRNPLSKKVIYTALLRTLGFAFVLLAFGLGAVYLVLWV